MYNLSIPLGSILFLRPNKIMSDKDLPDKINSTAATEFRQQGYLALMIKTSWDNFAIQAQIIVEQLGATVLSREVGADLCHWRIDFEGTKLGLFYEDTSESCWLELEQRQEQEVLDFIATLLRDFHGH